MVSGQHNVWEIRRSYQSQHTLVAGIEIIEILDAFELVAEDVKADNREYQNPSEDCEHYFG